MLPKSMKKKVMDYVESGVEKVSAVVDTDQITKRINLWVMGSTCALWLMWSACLVGDGEYLCFVVDMG
jgi:hypothetical protein